MIDTINIGDATLLTGDCIDAMAGLPEKSVNTCITSPPYFGLRDYGHDGQVGLEHMPDEYVAKLVEVFRAVRRVLRDDGTVWLNLGDSYAGSKGGNQGKNGEMANRSVVSARCHVRGYAIPPPGLKHKDLIGIPWRVAFALQADGWYLRQDIIWAKPNPMPESVKDRCTKSHEYIFLLSKNAKYWYDHEAIKEPVAAATASRMAQNIDGQKGSDRVPGKNNGPMKAVLSKSGNKHRKARPGPDKHTGKQAGSIPWEGAMRNKRDVWTVTTKPYKGAHFATFPPDLIEPCVLAGCPPGGVVLDPFSGSGTTGQVALQHGRKYVGIELNVEYQTLAAERISKAIGAAPAVKKETKAKPEYKSAKENNMSTEMRHEKFGGSTAERTIHCTGWTQQSEGIPRAPSSTFAEEGTALHNVMERVLLDGLKREEIKARFANNLFEGYMITSELVVDKVIPAFDAWTELKEKYNITDYEPEVRCMLQENVGGYADLIAVNATGDVFVIDWKMGYLDVSPVNSHQARFYGCAARKHSCVKEFFAGAKRFHAVIIQPSDSGADELKVWSTDIDALDEYEKLFLEAVAEAQALTPRLAVGEHCRWCPASSVCPERTGAAQRALHFNPDDLETLSANMAMVKELSEWIKAVEATVISQLEVGAEVSGWKLVSKRAMQKWVDEKEVLKKLRRKMGGKNNMFAEKLLSPAQMLKAAKAMDVEIDIEGLTHKISSGSTLAAADDKRPEAVNPATLAASLATIG